MKRVVAAVVFFVSIFTISAQTTLSFNPEKGAKYEYHTEMVQNIKTTVMGQEVPAEIKMDMMYLMEVKDKSEQESTVQFTFSEIAYIVSSLYMKMEFDSKNPNESPSDIDLMLSKMFKEMLGKSFTAVINTDGSVESVSGMEAIGESMTNAIARDGQMIAQLGAHMKEQFNDAAMKNMFETSFKVYPANPVRTGNSWDIENAVTMNNLNVMYKSKYTLRSVSRNVATVAVDTKIEMNPEAGIVEGSNISGTQTGTLTIDTRTGMILTGNVTANMKGAMRTSGMDVQMVLDTKTKTSTKMIE